MHDAEEGLGLTVELLVPGDEVLMCAEVGEGAQSPGHGVAEAFGGAGLVGGIFGAFIEGHADVGAEGDLDVHGVFRGEEVGAAVEVGAEADAFLRNLSEFGEGEDLESAGVGEHGAGPADELVEAAEGADEFMAGAEVEVVGIAEDDLRAEVFEDVLRDGLDGALGADGHEDGGFNDLMGKVDAGTAGAGRGSREEFEAQGHLFIVRGGFCGRIFGEMKRRRVGREGSCI